MCVLFHLLSHNIYGYKDKLHLVVADVVSVLMYQFHIPPHPPIFGHSTSGVLHGNSRLA